MIFALGHNLFGDFSSRANMKYFWRIYFRVYTGDDVYFFIMILFRETRPLSAKLSLGSAARARKL